MCLPVRKASARQFDGWYRLETTKRLLLCSCARREMEPDCQPEVKPLRKCSSKYGGFHDQG